MLHQQAGKWDSVDLASHLERLARKGDLPQGWQLALDMYTKLGLHDRQCQMLLNKVTMSYMYCISPRQAMQSLCLTECAFAHRLAFSGQQFSMQLRLCISSDSI